MSADLDHLQALVLDLDELGRRDAAYVRRCAAFLKRHGELPDEDWERLRSIRAPPDEEAELEA